MPVTTARPCITGDGRIELWCGACDRAAPAPVATAAAAVPAATTAIAPVVSRSTRGGLVAAVAGVAVVAGLAGALWHRGPAAVSSVSVRAAAAAGGGAGETVGAIATVGAAASVEVGVDVNADADADAAAAAGAGGTVTAGADGTVTAGGEKGGSAVPARFVVPVVEDEALDEWYPALRDWVHPVPGTDELVPVRSSRWFGARRVAVDRPECGRGHCGLDLDGERGQAVVAVAWGTVQRVQHDPSGRGGRYVRIEHPDGLHTSYFHLDRIAPGLTVGDEVEAGTPLGALGASGIHASAPHLHFALEIADHGKDHYVDPTPFLARATVLDRDPSLDAAVALGAHEPGW